MEDNLKRALKEAAKLQAELVRALDHGDDALAERLVAELSIVERRRNRLVHRSAKDSPAYSTATSLRDQVIRGLTVLGRPASARLISDLSKARWGEPIPTKRLSSLRRDEQNSWIANPGSRATYVTAAITGDRFAPVRGVLALSSWPLEVRIQGPTSQRVDLLHNIVNLTGELTHVGDTTTWRSAFERLVTRLARTVPMATDASGIGVAPDIHMIQEACRSELAATEPADKADRQLAAQRADRQLGDDQKLFGVRIQVVSGEAAAGDSL